MLQLLLPLIPIDFVILSQVYKTKLITNCLLVCRALWPLARRSPPQGTPRPLLYERGNSQLVYFFFNFIFILKRNAVSSMPGT